MAISISIVIQRTINVAFAMIKQVLGLWGGNV